MKPHATKWNVVLLTYGSDRCSAGSAVSSSDSSGLASGAPSGKSSSIRGAVRCSPPRTGPKRSASWMCATWTHACSRPSISSAVGFPARMCPRQARELASMVLVAVYGGSFGASSKTSPPRGSSSKTSPPAQTVGSMPFVGAWQSSGTKRYRSQLARAMSEHRTAGIASSWSADLLPTPTSSSYGTSGNGDPGDGRGEFQHKGKPSLQTLALRRMLPTPTASEGQKGANPIWSEKDRSPTLSSVVLYPTPTAGDAKASGSRCAPGSNAHAGTSLTDATVRQTNRGGAGASGHLSPQFVEWMMGLPRNWTKHVCDPLETPLFRSVLKSSER